MICSQFEFDTPLCHIQPDTSTKVKTLLNKFPKMVCIFRMSVAS